MIPTFLERVMEEELSFGQLEKLLWKSTLVYFNTLWSKSLSNLIKY